MKNFFMMTAGCILLSVSNYFFKIPNNFAMGGVTGIGMLLGDLTSLSAGTWILLINVAILLLGFLILGKETLFKTIYCSLLFSGLIKAFEILIPLSAPLTNYPLLDLVYAILLAAIGSALIFNANASSGGTDIVALILKKYTSLDVGKALLAVDFTIVLTSFYIFSIEAGLFSTLGLFIKAFLVDAVIENLNTCKYFIVITTERERISEFIIKTLKHGATVNTVTGEYTKENKSMIHTVCKRSEAIALRSKIKEIDPHAFIIISTSSEIIGKGFRGV